MDEFASIRHWTAGRQSDAWQTSRGVTLGIGDDAAAVDPAAAKDGIAGGKQLLLAVDTMVETVHFNQITMRDEDVGFKSLASNVSDIAAMGGVPLHALAAVSVPKSYGPERMRRLYDGLYECADRYGVAVIGGDTTSAPDRLVITITLTGTIEAGRELRRSGAEPGDVVFLTGPVGMSAAGLHLLLVQDENRRERLLTEKFSEPLIEAHRRPSPSVRAGRLLLELGDCHSLNDVSDGLASEAWEIAEASGLRVVLHERMLPKSGSMCAYARLAGTDVLDWMLYGGEDYVLLGTMASEAAAEAKAAFRAEGLPFFIIGETEEGDPSVELVRSEPGESSGTGLRTGVQLGAGVSGFVGSGPSFEIRQPVSKRGYNHFEG